MAADVLPIGNMTYLEAAQVLGRAFRDDPLSVVILRGKPPDERVKHMTALFTAGLSVCMRRGCPLAVTERGKTLAAAIIYPPGTYPVPLHEQVRVVFKTIGNAGLYGLGRATKVFGDLAKRHPKDNHYYLQFIGVEPALQGKGMGSAILSHLVQRADDDHVGCYLENPHSRNVPLYQRFGFQIVHQEPVIGVSVWFMWRPPNTGGG